MHRRRQRVRFGGQVACEVHKCLQRVLETLRWALGHSTRDGALQLGERGK